MRAFWSKSEYANTGSVVIHSVKKNSIANIVTHKTASSLLRRTYLTPVSRPRSSASPTGFLRGTKKATASAATPKVAAST